MIDNGFIVWFSVLWVFIALLSAFLGFTMGILWEKEKRSIYLVDDENNYEQIDPENPRGVIFSDN